MSAAAGIWGVPYLVTATVVAALMIVLFVLGQGRLRRSLLGLLFLIMAVLLSSGLVHVAPDGRTALGAARFGYVLLVLVPPGAVEFIRVLVGRPLGVIRSVAWGAAAAFGLASAATPLIVAGVYRYAYGYNIEPGPLYPLLAMFLVAAGLLPLLLWRQLKQERRSEARVELAALLVAGTLSPLALVDALAAPFVALPPVGWLPLCAAAVSLLWSVIHHRLFGVHVGAKRSLAWLGLSLLGAVPFVLVALVVGPPAGRAGTVPFVIFTAGLALLMRIYLRHLWPRLEELLGRRRRGLVEELATLEDRAATLQTAEELGRVVDGFLRGMDRRLAALVVIDQRGRPRIAFSAWGAVPAPARTSPLWTELAHVRSLISVEELRGPRRFEVERACVRWGAAYVGPLGEGEELLGLLAISPRQGRGAADAVEREVMERVRVIATTSLTGARLYERLHALSVELEQKATARAEALALALADLRGAEERLVRTEKLASLGQLVAGVAVDLRTELAAVGDGVRALRRQAARYFEAVGASAAAGDPRVAELLSDVGPLVEAVGEGARRALAIAEDLGRFAAEPDAAPVGERTPAHLASLLDATLTLVTRHLADVAVVRDYDETLPPVPVETGPLGQVILNLVLNATQAMRGSGTLTLGTRRRGEWAELSVADTGPGIPPAVLPHIFEPFYTTKGPQAGTGLGLAISFTIVQRHGGEIRVESVEGRGTTFRVLLPMTGVSKGVGEPPRTRDPAPGVDSAISRG